MLVPNIIQGDAVPHDLLSTIAPLPSQAEQSVTDKAANTARVGVNLPSFLTRNREGVVLPLVKRIAKELKADPQVEKLGAVGFCWCVWPTHLQFPRNNRAEASWIGSL